MKCAEAQVVQPAGIQQGGRNVGVARLLREQLAAQRDDLRQVHVVEYGLPVADALETGVQPAAHVHDHRIGVPLDEAADGTVEIPPADDAADFAQLRSVEAGIVVLQTLHKTLRGLVVQDGMPAAAFFRSVIERDEQCLGDDALELMFPFHFTMEFISEQYSDSFMKKGGKIRKDFLLFRCPLAAAFPGTGLLSVIP